MGQAHLYKVGYTNNVWRKLVESDIKKIEMTNCKDVQKMSSETLETMRQIIRMNLTTAQLKRQF